MLYNKQRTSIKVLRRAAAVSAVLNMITSDSRCPLVIHNVITLSFEFFSGGGGGLDPLRIE